MHEKKFKKLLGRNYGTSEKEGTSELRSKYSTEENERLRLELQRKEEEVRITQRSLKGP